MLLKLFRKQTDSRPRFEQDASMSEALQRRVNSIDFQPSRGFLKDQKQPKRSSRGVLPFAEANGGMAEATGRDGE